MAETLIQSAATIAANLSTVASQAAESKSLLESIKYSAVGMCSI